MAPVIAAVTTLPVTRRGCSCSSADEALQVRATLGVAAQCLPLVKGKRHDGVALCLEEAVTQPRAPKAPAKGWGNIQLEGQLAASVPQQRLTLVVLARVARPRTYLCGVFAVKCDGPSTSSASAAPLWRTSMSMLVKLAVADLNSSSTWSTCAVSG
jgi:hypothetical protein